ncbi:hypothetical protein VNO78_23662 [Psophocarpus tetragonolobus]|uniref:Dof zinc finger protein n=1 Tax=Psophocarpus tetragonolobus TaxID=3891 RepID=A0AAN9S4W4_PSOTE
MQEIHSMSGPRFFSGAATATGDRRLRPHHQNHQALKCPRCDSLNTKFCYYNNYNLSQPRHFCKNCRRYWTKGGVLRNVPVGGGCRKSKRSNKPSKTCSQGPAAEPEPEPEPERELNNSHSSSDSSNLAAVDGLSAPLNSDSNSMQEDSKFLIPATADPLLEAPPLQQGTGDCSAIFSDIGPFTSLITTSSNDALTFGFSNSLPDASTSFHWQHPKLTASDDLKLPDASLLDPPVDFSSLHTKTNHPAFGSFDWHSSPDPPFFDLPNTVDHPYWTHSHWSDHDNSPLFHLP